MIDLRPAREQVHTDLGYKPLSRGWAKLEILFGLLAVALGVLLMLWWMNPSRGGENTFVWLSMDPLTLALAVVLFILGGYLTLAGHRSHLYQSMNDRTAYLLEQMRRLNTKS